MPTATLPAPRRAHTKATLAREIGLSWKTIIRKCADADITLPKRGSILTAVVVQAVRRLFVGTE